MASFADMQRESLLAGPRQAAALEKIAMLLEAYCKKEGVKLPEALPAPEKPEAPAAQSYNPYTESAPGVPLPGQEAEQPSKEDKKDAKKTS